MADDGRRKIEAQPALADEVRNLGDARRSAMRTFGAQGQRMVSRQVQQQTAEMIAKQFGTARISKGLLELARELPALLKKRADTVLVPEEVQLVDGRYVRISDPSVIVERTFAPLNPKVTTPVKKLAGFGIKHVISSPDLSEDVERALIHMTPGHTVLQENIQGHREIGLTSFRTPRFEWVFRLLHREPHEVAALGPTPEELARMAAHEQYSDGYGHGMFVQQRFAREDALKAAQEAAQREARAAEVAAAETRGRQSGVDEANALRERTEAAARDLLALGAGLRNGALANGALANGVDKDH